MQQLTYDFGFGEKATHFLYRAGRIAEAKAESGIYAWYLRPPRNEADEVACNPYRRVFSERRFRVNAAAPLGERMHGYINRRQAELRPPTAGEELDEELFMATFAAFSPPVYIGRSRNVRARLSAHVRNLEAELARGVEAALAATNLEAAVADTDAESSQFGTRMGVLLGSRGIKDYRGLFVKVVYADSDAATRRVEYLLNRTFHPVLGRL